MIDLIVDRNRNELMDRKGSNSAAHSGENNSGSYRGGGYCFAPFSISSCFARKRHLLILLIYDKVYNRKMEINT